MKMPHRHYLLILAVLFGIWWVALAIHASHRNTWLLENAGHHGGYPPLDKGAPMS